MTLHVAAEYPSPHYHLLPEELNVRDGSHQLCSGLFKSEIAVKPDAMVLYSRFDVIQQQTVDHFTSPVHLLPVDF